MRTVKTCYDTQGRPAKVTQKATPSAAETDAAKAEAVAGIPAYAPHGGLLSLKLGPSGAVEEKTLYNSRLQPYRMSAGVWQTDLFYCAGATDPAASCTSNNGNFHKQVLQALNGVTYTAGYTYDPINRLKTAIETKPGTPNPVENWRQTYVYDPYGNRAQLAEAGRLATMEGATVSVPSETPLVWPFNAKNQWTGAEFDLSGNQETTWGPNGTDARAAKFVFDGENRIATATVTNGVGAVSYGYDGDGRRVTSTVGGVTTTFVYDAFGAMVAEYGSALGNSGCLSCLVTVDHLGSTRVVWDAAGGAPVRLYDYSPFGEEVNATLRAGDGRYPALIYPVSTRNDVSPLFTGKECDAETGLDYFGARYMSAAQGRFTSPDWSATPVPIPYAQIENPQSLNLYAYVRNNPLRSADVDGHTDYYTPDGKKVGSDGVSNGAVAVANRSDIKQDSDGVVMAYATKTQYWIPRAVGEAVNEITDRSNAPAGTARGADTQGGFHEESFTATPNGTGIDIAYSEHGPVARPGDREASVTQAIPVGATFKAHTHPRGAQGSAFGGGMQFDQNPSPWDLRGAGINAEARPGLVNMVVGAQDQRVKIFDSTGTRATVPLSAFPRRR
jgi:RHS repeat-associated protein